MMVETKENHVFHNTKMYECMIINNFSYQFINNVQNGRPWERVMDQFGLCCSVEQWLNCGLITKPLSTWFKNLRLTGYQVSGTRRREIRLTNWLDFEPTISKYYKKYKMIQRFRKIYNIIYIYIIWLLFCDMMYLYSK